MFPLKHAMLFTILFQNTSCCVSHIVCLNILSGLKGENENVGEHVVVLITVE